MDHLHIGDELNVGKKVSKRTVLDSSGNSGLLSVCTTQNRGIHSVNLKQYLAVYKFNWKVNIASMNFVKNTDKALYIIMAKIRWEFMAF